MPSFADLLDREGTAREGVSLAEAGFRRRRIEAVMSPHELAEGRALIRRTLEGSRYHGQLFLEAMSTSDFPDLFGDTLDRMMLGSFTDAAAQVNLRAFIKHATVPDFRTVKRFALDGAEGQLGVVGQGQEYPETSVDDKADSYAVAKFGRQIPMLWESWINDDLDAFRDLPVRLGTAAARTRVKENTKRYCDASGPHASLYTSGNANIVHTDNGAAATNPGLSVAGLQDALTVLGNMVDTDGEPIVFTGFALVVPPALRVTAENLLAATVIKPRTSGGATSAQEIEVANWMSGDFTLVVDPYIPIVASTANGNTSWWVFGRPESTGRPALEFGVLRGHAEPEIFVKSPNARRVGGGDADPFGGDFATDSIAYKVRDVHGGSRLATTGGFRSTVASNGSGS